MIFTRPLFQNPPKQTKEQDKRTFVIAAIINISRSESFQRGCSNIANNSFLKILFRFKKLVNP